MSELTDKLRRLAAEWRGYADSMRRDYYSREPEFSKADAFADCADELESLLAEHAGDEAPVTAEWMQEVFGDWPVYVLSGPFCVDFGDHAPTLVFIDSDRTHWRCPLQPVKTRGEVRELCRVLGKPIGGES